VCSSDLTSYTSVPKPEGCVPLSFGGALCLENKNFQL
jgi:hypothetical protein